jgi:hypothetical protein
MIAARNARNEICHYILQNYDPSRTTPELRAHILERLGQLRFDVGLGFLHMRELRKVAEESIGFTEEQILKLLDDFENGKE